MKHQSRIVNCNVGNKTFYNTQTLILQDYSDTYILVRGDITIVGDNGVEVAFKNCAPFITCIRKNDRTTIDSPEDLDLVITMYNLLWDSLNYSDMAGSLRFYPKNGATNFNADVAKKFIFKFFVYITKLVGETEAQRAPNNNIGVLKNATIAVPFKCLSNFWRYFEMPLINCKVELKPKLTDLCVLAGACVKNVDANSNNVICSIKNTKLYVPVVTLSAKDNQKLLKLLSEGFERPIY